MLRTSRRQFLRTASAGGRSYDVAVVGGGSGHGFKHEPALGAYVADRVLDRGAVEARFSLATKAKVQKRSVY